MSRIGRAPINVPAGVDVNIDSANSVITVKGPKGTLTLNYHNRMTVKLEGGVITVTRPTDEKEDRALHGLTRTLIYNLVVGVTEGYTKKLEVNGVGYRVAMQGKNLNLTLGYSHPVVVEAPEGITFETPDANTILVRGIDKQLVGETAAYIRSRRAPEPYKGKGIKYEGEKIRRKAGKTGK
ncbi:MAG: 50S ribosomal protein L6 [Clostridia bacterium]|nr:50S ribosomal protein L6 [Clostridia bacterium]MBR2296481.1 50S ribosomal protein L6 [Clostridia bacterium]